MKTREEVVKPIPERIRKKSRKKTAEQVAASSFEVERRSGSSSGEPHADLATQVRKGNGMKLKDKVFPKPILFCTVCI